MGQLTVNPDGSLAAPYTLSLSDKSVSLTFSAGTIITADGEMPDRIEVEAVLFIEEHNPFQNILQCRTSAQGTVFRLRRLSAYHRSNYSKLSLPCERRRALGKPGATLGLLNRCLGFITKPLVNVVSEGLA